MTIDRSDALARFDHVRADVAALDKTLARYNLKAHRHGHGTPFTDQEADSAATVMGELAEACRSFADAVDELAEALSG